MPSGKVHDRLTVATATLSLPLWLIVSPQHDLVAYTAGVTSYLFSGFWLSGDLDTNSVSYKRWGIFKFIWLPYRLLVPHRSCISHGIIVGPILRVVYFAAAAWIVARVACVLINQYFLVEDKTGILQHTRLSLWTWVAGHPAVTIAALVGLILGGLTHTVADVLGSFWKKVW